MHRCVNKNNLKGYFFRAGQCAALSSFRVGKMLFLYEKGIFFFFTNFTEGCRSKRVGVLILLLEFQGKGYFLTGHSEKG